jgi:DNA-binding SARP family transcriptional activator
MGVRIALFGQPRALSSDGSREYSLPRKTLNVLAYLILNRRRAPTRDTIAFTLFPDDDEETARNALRRNLSYLLQALPDGRQFVDADAERIAWNPAPPVHVDVLAFEQAVSEGRDADTIAEYTGQLLPTIYDEWATADRERLRDAFHAALSRTVALDRSRRNYDAATATAHRLLDDDPWREDIVRQLMAIRYEAGDRAGALSAFERFSALLRNEMQTEPMPETFALRDAVLRGARLATSEPPRSVRDAPIVSDHGLPFVGRDAAMKRAHGAWQSAADGRAGLLFISGEAGVGNCRFTTELVRLAEREGGFIVRGYTSAGGEQQPYEAFVEALHGTPSPLDDRAGAELSDDRAARLRFFDSVRGRLSELSRARPIVLVLEDLHWAGASTIELLDFLARRLERNPVLIVATSRSDEFARAHPLRALRRDLQHRGVATEIALDRLNVDDATRAARAALPETVDEGALTRVISWVDGVPLLLAEAVRDLAAGRTSTASSMTTLIAERFERLSSSAETVLIFGAVLGERFDLGTLAAATAWRDDQILDAIGEWIECGFVRAVTRSPELAFEFTHDLVRVAAMERISESDLTRAHGLIARAIRAQAPESGTRARQIARHFAAAGEQLRAAKYFRSAARYALGVFANEESRESASAGLALCDENEPSQRALRYDLVDLREQSLARIGATGQRRNDARLLVTLADGEEPTAVALGRLFEASATDAVGRKEALDRLSALAGASELAARTHANAAARHAYLEGDYGPRARGCAALGGRGATRRRPRGGDEGALDRDHLSHAARVVRTGRSSDQRAAADRGCERGRRPAHGVSLGRVGGPRRDAPRGSARGRAPFAHARAAHRGSLRRSARATMSRSLPANWATMRKRSKSKSGHSLRTATSEMRRGSAMRCSTSSGCESGAETTSGRSTCSTRWMWRMKQRRGWHCAASSYAARSLSARKGSPTPSATCSMRVSAPKSSAHRTIGRAASSNSRTCWRRTAVRTKQLPMSARHSRRTQRWGNRTSKLRRWPSGPGSSHRWAMRLGPAHVRSELLRGARRRAYSRTARSPGTSRPPTR